MEEFISFCFRYLHQSEWNESINQKEKSYIEVTFVKIFLQEQMD